VRNLNNFLFILETTLTYSAPLIFGALAGVISERAGVINIGIEGMMVGGAFAGASVGYFTGNPWLGFLAGGLIGGMIALLHAVACINFCADQTVSGIALNLIGPGLSLFFSRWFFNGTVYTEPVKNNLPKILGSKKIDITVIFALLFTVFIYFLLYKTKWGLRIKAIGEHPAAADTLGINVYKIKYLCVIFSGVLAGFGGAAVTLATISQFTPTAIHGQGFIALAAVIFGKWKPHGAYAACLLFGSAQALAVMLGGESSKFPSEIIAMLPYVLTIIVLILFVGKSSAPKANGIAYEKGTR